MATAALVGHDPTAEGAGADGQSPCPPAAPTSTPDRPALTEPQVPQLVWQRIPSETNRQGLREYARLEYLGRGKWLVQYGSEATWLVKERERRAEPLDEWACSLENQVWGDDERAVN